ncbi:hypothetical protein PROFUN_05292 [Planoprotostelium fungivorum]|uniref:Peptidase S53 domain-containing protein n=1 Tax=Planoprotostelium fungivorum TaxID=1890364 RepID=A0A2P6NRF2_9EUKA|nr:hypothetical protein PROFUN_05292 [Planoprotostelium fungivorum]
MRLKDHFEDKEVIDETRNRTWGYSKCRNLGDRKDMYIIDSISVRTVDRYIHEFYGKRPSIRHTSLRLRPYHISLNRKRWTGSQYCYRPEWSAGVHHKLGRPTMHSNVILLVLLALGAFTEARVYEPGKAREFMASRKHGWTAAGKPAQNKVRELFIALKERNLDEVERIALEISNPDSPSFSQHLSFHELKALTAPHASDVAEWLDAEGIDYETTPAGGHIKISATTAQVERLFDCKLSTYIHSASAGVTPPHMIHSPTIAANPIIRSETPYRVPKHLDNIVQFVTPLHGFPKSPLARVRSHTTEPSPNSPIVRNVTPDVIRSRYNVTAPVIDLKVNNTQAVFEQENMDPADLQYFFQKFAPKLTSVKVVKYLGDVDNDPTRPGNEASLDIQYLAALGGFAPTYYYNYNDGDEYTAFLKYAIDLVNDPKPPLVHSISWVLDGGYPIDEVNRISDEYMKLGTRGVTTIYGSALGLLLLAPPEFILNMVKVILSHLLFLTQTDGSYSEVGTEFSGGGFANEVGIPAWQQAAVDKFLKTPNLPTSYFNASGRVGTGFRVVVKGFVGYESGTSCSAPTFSGMISIINGIRLKNGKKPLGFINPLLYKAATIPNAFYDVVSGSNRFGRCPGFHAVAGWDPITGLGTPNFVVLAKYAISLP